MHFNAISAANVSLSVCKDQASASWLSASISNLPVIANTSGHSLLYDYFVSSTSTNSTQQPTYLFGCLEITAIAGDVVVLNRTVYVHGTVSQYCQLGTASSTGTNYPHICEFCELGTYAPTTGLTSCTPCPESIPETSGIGKTSLSDCQQCPLGWYCPIGSPPLICPESGGYEPFNAQLSDRRVVDCVSVPCSPGYWCGPGAAEGSTYVQVLIFENMISSATVLLQSWTTDAIFENLDTNDSIVIKPTFLPDWASFTPITVGANSEAIGQFVFDTAKMNSTSVVTSNAIFEWYKEKDPSLSFNISIYLEFTIVTVIVTPTSFQYSAAAITEQLNSPIPTQMQIFNTLCNNSVTLTISSTTCTGINYPGWFLFGFPSPFSPILIDAQAGLPTTVTFSLDPAKLNVTKYNFTGLTHAPLSGIPVALYSELCFNMNFELNGLNIVVVTPIYVQFRQKTQCPPGTFSSSGDDSQGCSTCAVGFYQDLVGQTYCQKCPQGSPITRFPGSMSADDCLTDIGYFLSLNATSSSCPNGAECNQIGLNIENLVILPAYWRTRPTSLIILPCPFPIYCKGGQMNIPVPWVNDTIPQISRRLSTTVTNDYIYSDNLCISNHTGTYCYACIPGAVKRGINKICSSCTPELYSVDQGRVAGIFFALSFLAALVLGLIYFCTYRTYSVIHGYSSETVSEVRLANISAALDIRAPVVIIISYIQVVSGMSVTFQDVLPPFFQQLRNIFTFLALDFVSIIDFGCALAAQNHLTSLLISTLLPIGSSILILFVHLFLEVRVAKEDVALKEEFRTTSFTLFLVIIFLIYPSCSNTILATFTCVSFDDGTSVISRDPSVSCTSYIYEQYWKYAIFMLFVYPVGIPVFYSILLYRERKRLNPIVGKDPHLIKVAEAMRMTNRDIRYLKFLWAHYKPKYFWFEVFELIRKLSQTSIVVFVAPGSSPQIVFQLLTTVVSVVVLNSFSPYYRKANNYLAVTAQWSLFGISLTTLLIKYTQISGLAPEYNQNALNALMTILFLIVPCFALVRISLQAIGAYREVFFCVDWGKMYERVCKSSIIQGLYDRYFPSFEPTETVQRRKTIAAATSGMPAAQRRTTIMGDEIPQHAEFQRRRQTAVDFLDKRRKTVIELEKIEVLEKDETSMELFERLKVQFNAVRLDLERQIEREKEEIDRILDEREILQDQIAMIEKELESAKIQEVNDESHINIEDGEESIFTAFVARPTHVRKTRYDESAESSKQRRFSRKPVNNPPPIINKKSEVQSETNEEAPKRTGFDLFGRSKKSDLGIAKKSDLGIAKKSDLGIAKKSELGIAKKSDLGPAKTSELGIQKPPNAPATKASFELSSIEKKTSSSGNKQTFSFFPRKSDLESSKPEKKPSSGGNNNNPDGL